MRRVCALSLVAVSVAIALLLGRYYSADLPRSNPVLYAFFPDDTHYTTGYRESRFREISLGMSAADVRDLLGPPLSIREFAGGRFIREIDVAAQQDSAAALASDSNQEAPLDEVAYLYSEPGGHFDNYYVRTVTFGRDGRVSSRSSEFYSD